MTTTLRFTSMVGGAAVLILTVAAVLTAKDWVSPAIPHRIAVQTAVPTPPTSAPAPQTSPAPQPGDNRGQDAAPAAAVSTPQPPAAAGQGAVDQEQGNEENEDRPVSDRDGDRGRHASGAATRSGEWRGRGRDGGSR